MNRPANKLTLAQRAYLLGHRRALNRARSELRELAERFEDDVAALADETRQFCNDVVRARQIEKALDAPRDDDDLWLQ